MRAEVTKFDKYAPAGGIEESMTQGGVLKRPEEAFSSEERAGIAARAKFAEWRRIEAEERPRRILYWAIAGGAGLAIVILGLMHI